MSGLVWELEGDETAFEVAGLLEATARQLVDTGPVMVKIARDMMAAERATFYGQGRRGGGSWAPLAPDTIRKKGVGYQNILRTDLANPGYSQIEGHASSDTLFKSLTEPGAAYQILDVTPEAIRFGTTRPYAGAHQYGSWLRFIPKRPFMNFLETDIERWNAMLRRHIMAPMMAKNQENVDKSM